MKKELAILMLADIPLNLAQACLAFLSTFHLMKDADSKILNYDDCEKLAEEGKLDKASYWWPSKDGFAFVLPSRFMEYSKTVDQIRQAYSDFKAGWYACEKMLKK